MFLVGIATLHAARGDSFHLFRVLSKIRDFEAQQIHDSEKDANLVDKPEAGEEEQVAAHLQEALEVAGADLRSKLPLG